MLRHRADVKTVIYMAITTGLLVVQWTLPRFSPILFAWACLMAVAVAVIAHNHNHVGIWKSKRLNWATDYWITLFYGFPAFSWIATHNRIHHRLVNREGDHSITYRLTEKNNLLTLLSYPVVSGAIQQAVVWRYLAELRHRNWRRFVLYAGQIVALVVYLLAAFLLDWRKALLYILIPQQFSLFTILLFNYVQHVHADEESALDHSRNFVGKWINAFLFNNGYHTAHHERPGLHWSRTQGAHASIASALAPELQERNFLWYLLRAYVLGIFVPRFRTRSMRLARIAAARE